MSVHRKCCCRPGVPPQPGPGPCPDCNSNDCDPAIASQWQSLDFAEPDGSPAPGERVYVGSAIRTTNALTANCSISNIPLWRVTGGLPAQPLNGCCVNGDNSSILEEGTIISFGEPHDVNITQANMTCGNVKIVMGNYLALPASFGSPFVVELQDGTTIDPDDPLNKWHQLLDVNPSVFPQIDVWAVHIVMTSFGLSGSQAPIVALRVVQNSDLCPGVGPYPVVLFGPQGGTTNRWIHMEGANVQVLA